MGDTRAEELIGKEQVRLVRGLQRALETYKEAMAHT